MAERRRSLPAGVALVVVLLAACHGKVTGGLPRLGQSPGGVVGSPDPAGAGCAFDPKASRDFNGTARIDLSYRDAFGNTYQRSYARMDAGIELRVPIEDEGVVEPNPLHLSFGTETQATQGSFLGNSAVPFVDPNDGKHILIRYWALQADCNRLSGTLEDPHVQEGLAHANGVVGQKNLGAGLGFFDWPFVMGKGTSLEATAGQGDVVVTVRGTDTEAILDFSIRMELSA